MFSFKRNTKTKVLFTLLVLFTGLVLFFIYKLTRPPAKHTNVVDNITKTTSSAPTADSNFSSGNERPVESNDLENSTIIADDKGSIETIPSKSSWTVSSTGEITAYSPGQNGLFKNGDKIFGESSLSTVSFRVIDSVSGVIAEGSLSVVNGKFAGSISLSTAASEGRLDLFGLKEDGLEFSNIEIPVRFK